VFLQEAVPPTPLQTALDRAAALVSRHLSGDWLDGETLRLSKKPGISGELLP